MVVGEDHGGGVIPESSLDYFTRINARLGQRPLEKLFGSDNPVLCVEKQAHENLMLQRGQKKTEIIAHGCGRVQGIASGGSKARLQTTKGGVDQGGIVSV
jgi:hypothetical protein